MRPPIPTFCRIYSYLILLYPRDFRHEFAGEMIAAFGDELREGSPANVCLFALYEIFTIALPMHLRSALFFASAGSLVGTSTIYYLLAWALTETSHSRLGRP